MCLLRLPTSCRTRTHIHTHSHTHTHTHTHAHAHPAGCLVAACDDEHLSVTPLHHLRRINDTQTPTAIEATQPRRQHNFAAVVAEEEACFQWLYELGDKGFAVIKGAGSDEDAVVDLANRISYPQVGVHFCVFGVGRRG